MTQINSLLSLRRVKNDKPPRLTIYSAAGCGKTTLAAEFPNPVFITTEDGIPDDLEIVAFPQVTSYPEFVQYIKDLGEQEHDRKTLVIDTIDSLQPILIAQVCAENGWNSIEDPGYGKGYVELESKFREVIGWLNWLRATRNMAIVILSHFEISKFQDPESEGYDRYGIRLHKRLAPLLIDDMDAVVFMNYQKQVKQADEGFNKTRAYAESAGVRVLHFEERAGFIAKNRYAFPPQLIYNKGQGYAALAPYLKGMDSGPTPVAPPAETVTEGPTETVGEVDSTPTMGGGQPAEQQGGEMPFGASQ